jgi:hypothetical protein
MRGFLFETRKSLIHLFIVMELALASVSVRAASDKVQVDPYLALDQQATHLLETFCEPYCERSSTSAPIKKAKSEPAKSAGASAGGSQAESDRRGNDS